MSIKILLLEDDLLFAETLTDLLQEQGYELVHSPNGQDSLECTFEQKFDLYILDINVPLIDGVSVLRELRAAEDNTPAIFLTSYKSQEMLEKGFLNGGDDYLTKPFNNKELLLRIEALLRRTQKAKVENRGKLKHDRVHKSIFYDDKALELSKKEYDLLVILMTHANKSVPKELISSELWSSSEGGSDGAIRVYINRLKQLLPEQKIENIRGIGYKLVC